MVKRCEQAVADSGRLGRIFHLSIVVALLLGSSCHRRDSISQFTEGARAEATKWQADAQLVEVHALNFITVEGNPPTLKSGPPQIVTYYFFSPSTHRSLHVDAMQQGFQSHPDELAASPFTIPIPADFESLEDALAQVRKSSGNDILVSEADLRVYWNAAGQPERTAWKITFSRGTGMAQTSDTKYVDAASGAIVAVEDRSVPPPNPGTTEAAQLPAGEDFAAFRRAADRNAAVQGAGFKLYSASLDFRLPEPVYEAPEPPDSKVKINAASFDYARSTPTVNWESVAINEGNTNPEAAMAAYVDPVVQEVPPNATPQVIPDDLPDPEPFLRQLRDSFPKQTKHDPKGLYAAGEYQLIEGGYVVPLVAQPTARAWLSRRGNLYPTRENDPPSPEEYDFFNSTAPPNRWVWWTIVKHARFLPKPGQPIVGYLDPLEGWQQFIYIDAITGARSTRCTPPACIYNCCCSQPVPPMPSVSCE